MSQEERAKPIGSVELAKLTAPIYTHVIECFGPERCMWESNFPVRIRPRAQCCHVSSDAFSFAPRPRAAPAHVTHVHCASSADRQPPGRVQIGGTCMCCVQVDKVNVSYNVLWNAFKLISTELFGAVAGPEKDALFAGTAIKAYRLDVTLPAQQPAAL